MQVQRPPSARARGGGGVRRPRGGPVRASLPSGPGLRGPAWWQLGLGVFGAPCLAPAPGRSGPGERGAHWGHLAPRPCPAADSIQAQLRDARLASTPVFTLFIQVRLRCRALAPRRLRVGGACGGSAPGVACRGGALEHGPSVGDHLQWQHPRPGPGALTPGGVGLVRPRASWQLTGWVGTRSPRACVRPGGPAQVPPHTCVVSALEGGAGGSLRAGKGLVSRVLSCVGHVCSPLIPQLFQIDTTGCMEVVRERRARPPALPRAGAQVTDGQEPGLGSRSAAALPSHPPGSPECRWRSSVQGVRHARSFQGQEGPGALGGQAQEGPAHRPARLGAPRAETARTPAAGSRCAPLTHPAPCSSHAAPPGGDARCRRLSPWGLRAEG